MKGRESCIFIDYYNMDVLQWRTLNTLTCWFNLNEIYSHSSRALFTYFNVEKKKISPSDEAVNADKRSSNLLHFLFEWMSSFFAFRFDYFCLYHFRFVWFWLFSMFANTMMCQRSNFVYNVNSIHPLRKKQFKLIKFVDAIIKLSGVSI